MFLLIPCYQGLHSVPMKPWHVVLIALVLSLAIPAIYYAQLASESRSQIELMKTLEERGVNYMATHPPETKHPGTIFGLEYPADEVYEIWGQHRPDWGIISGWKCNDNDLALVSKLKNLERLYVSGTGLTDRGFEKLPGSALLNKLQVWSTSITDEGVKHFLKFPALVSLDLQSNNIGDPAISYIVQMDNLETLNLQETNVTEAGVKRLAELKSLKHLRLYDTPVGDGAFVDFDKLNQLETLEIGETKITDAGVDDLVKLKSLEHLSVYDCDISDAALARLKKELPNCEVDR